jgi:hypothetical protein
MVRCALSAADARDWPSPPRHGSLGDQPWPRAHQIRRRLAQNLRWSAGVRRALGPWQEQGGRPG